ncbi:MAG: winged helix-turn-helix transcriptional regulator [Candidatus Sumerlaeia bacterium]
MKDNNANPQQYRDLEVMELLEEDPSINQRHIASKTSMALGLVNSCLKRLARKGMVKIQEAPGRRYLYYLTPKGMTEKSRLTYEYVKYSVHYYSKARKKCKNLFETLEKEGVIRVAFLGNSDLAEIAYLSLQEYPLEFAGIYDGQNSAAHFFQNPVQALEALDTDSGKYDVLLYTYTESPLRKPELKDIEFREIF